MDVILKVVCPMVKVTIYEIYVGDPGVFLSMKQEKLRQ